MRVSELRNRARFTLEPLAELRISGQRVRQNLDRDDPIEPCVTGAIDLAHAAGPEGGENLVRAEADAGL